MPSFITSRNSYPSSTLALMFLLAITQTSRLLTTRAFQQSRRIRISQALIPNKDTFIIHPPPCGAVTALCSSAAASDSRDANNALLKGLNEAQIEAVTQPVASITRVVAGPGAGKTRVLTTRIAYLLQDCLSNDARNNRILAVTFTKKAAGEMQQRLEKILDETTEEPDAIPPRIEEGSEIFQQEEDSGRQSTALDRVTLGTFHSVCAKILRWNGKLLADLPTVRDAMSGAVNATNLDGSFAILDQSEQIRVIKDCLAAFDIDLKKERDMKPLNILNAVAKIKSLRANGEDLTKEDERNRAIKFAKQIYPLYRQTLLAANSLDFDDLIQLTRELLHVHDDVRDALQRRWTHVLVDEFQDSSKTQLDLVRLLTSTSLLVVGDADQSIYSWRGAHAESMSDFCNEFKDYHLEGVRTVFLMENYRSTTNIINAAQKIISAEAKKDNKSSKQSELRQDMKPMRGNGPTPRILACADAKAEANFVVNTIQDMIEKEELNSDQTVAVIYRTNAQSRAIEEACVKSNLPYVIRGTAGSFYNRAEIKDCLCFLRWLYNGRDQAAMKRVVKTPSKGIGEKALAEFLDYCSHLDEFYASSHPDFDRPTPLEVLVSLTNGEGIGEDFSIVQDAPAPTDFISKRALNRFIPFSSQMRLIRHKAHSETVSNLTSTIIEVMQLRDHFDSISKSSAEFADRWNNVQELRQAAQRYTDDGPALAILPEDNSDGAASGVSPLGNFLDDVALIADMGDDVDDESKQEMRVKANLMTIHGSKGMEFDVVFIVGNEDGTFPTHMAIMEGEHSIQLAEERRLCYVAMTRAKDNLVMTWRREVSSFVGQDFRTDSKKRSRFLDILVSKKSKTKSAHARKEAVSEPRKKQQRRFDQPLPRPASARAGVYGVQSKPTKRSISTATTSPSHRTRRPASPQLQRKNSPRKTPAVPSSPLTGARVQRKAILNAPPLGQRPSNGEFLPSNGKKAGGNRSVPSAQNLDSTWFYPVGSSVVHKQLGEGSVLQPLDKETVRVKFKNGKEVSMPALDAELYPN